MSAEFKRSVFSALAGSSGPDEQEIPETKSFLESCIGPFEIVELYEEGENGKIELLYQEIIDRIVKGNQVIYIDCEYRFDIFRLVSLLSKRLGHLSETIDPVSHTHQASILNASSTKSFLGERESKLEKFMTSRSLIRDKNNCPTKDYEPEAYCSKARSLHQGRKSSTDTLDSLQKERPSIKQCLRRLIIQKCPTSTDFMLFVVGSLEHLLLTNSAVAMVIVDSMNSFYWHDRYCNFDPKTVQCDIRSKLTQCAEKYHFSLVLAFQDLFRQRFFSFQPSVNSVLSVNRILVEKTGSSEFILKSCYEKGETKVESILQFTMENGLQRRSVCD